MAKDIKCITIGDQVKSMKTMAILMAGIGYDVKAMTRVGCELGYSNPHKPLNSKDLKGRGGACAKVPKPPRWPGLT